MRLFLRLYRGLKMTKINTETGESNNVWDFFTVEDGVAPSEVEADSCEAARSQSCN